jgi:hypothetical protein
MLKYIFITVFLISLAVSSCGKKESMNDKKTIGENEGDTNLTPQEVFSGTLVEDIIGDENDDDLRIYLEEQIYPIVNKSAKVTIDRISSSLYLLTYDENGSKKNIIIQKFYNPVTDEMVFEKNDTQTNSFKQFVK